MKKCLTGILCLVMLATIFMGTIAVSAESDSVDVVSLGDSIARAYGCEAEEAYGYLLADHMKSELSDRGYSVNFVNYGHDGDTTQDLLGKLKTKSKMIESVKNAEVITISIGGNNLIRGFNNELAIALDLDINSPSFFDDLATALQTTPPMALIAKLMPIFDENGEPYARLKAVAEKYKLDMKTIFDRIFELNSNAKVIVTTIPNPTKDETLNPLIGIYLDDYNNFIIKNCDYENANVMNADCNKAFQDYTGDKALTFMKVDWADMSNMNADPHPTPFGHTIMEQTHYPLIEDYVVGLPKVTTTTTESTTTTTESTTTTTESTTTTTESTDTTATSSTDKTTVSTKESVTNSTSDSTAKSTATATKLDSTTTLTSNESSPKTGETGAVTGVALLALVSLAGSVLAYRKQK